MTRLIVLWEHPTMGSPKDVDLWTRRQLAKLAADRAVEKAVLTRLAPAPRRTAWYGWLLELDVTDARVLDRAHPLMQLLSELRQLRLHPVVLVAAGSAHVQAET
jgi:hypothetical protein